MSTIRPSELPWNHGETAPGEQRCWHDLYNDLIDACDTDVVSEKECLWYLSMLMEMFNSGQDVMRNPWSVMAARLCFLHFEPGEA
jgi:hypothetical protein